ncbi:MAG: methyltransferase domain-containing protein [Sedimentisphaerales bacterium]|nr:methyltransferase domain-containing protein [Sedimentisphaerales bacterium]
MSECDKCDSARKNHSHQGRSSEARVDKHFILKQLDLQPGDTVLDAGCGNGYMAKEFAKLVTETGKIYALDPDEQAIQILQQETVGSNIEPFLSDITQPTKLSAGSLDLIYISTVVHGFASEQMAGFAAEVKRLLKPNGRLAVLEMKKEEMPFGPPMELKFSPEELQQTLGLTLFKQIEVSKYFYLAIFQNEN